MASRDLISPTHRAASQVAASFRICLKLRLGWLNGTAHEPEQVEYCRSHRSEQAEAVFVQDIFIDIITRGPPGCVFVASLDPFFRARPPPYRHASVLKLAPQVPQREERTVSGKLAGQVHERRQLQTIILGEPFPQDTMRE